MSAQYHTLGEPVDIEKGESCTVIKTFDYCSLVNIIAICVLMFAAVFAAGAFVYFIYLTFFHTSK